MSMFANVSLNSLPNDLRPRPLAGGVQRRANGGWTGSLGCTSPRSWEVRTKSCTVRRPWSQNSCLGPGRSAFLRGASGSGHTADRQSRMWWRRVGKKSHDLRWRCALRTLAVSSVRGAYMPPGESGFGWKGRSHEKLWRQRTRPPS